MLKVLLFISLLTQYSLYSDERTVRSPTGAACEDCPGQSWVPDEATPDAIARFEEDWHEPDDPEQHVPGQVGPFGE